MVAAVPVVVLVDGTAEELVTDGGRVVLLLGVD